MSVGNCWILFHLVLMLDFGMTDLKIFFALCYLGQLLCYRNLVMSPKSYYSSMPKLTTTTHWFLWNKMTQRKCSSRCLFSVLCYFFHFFILFHVYPFICDHMLLSLEVWKEFSILFIKFMGYLFFVPSVTSFVLKYGTLESIKWWT